MKPFYRQVVRIFTVAGTVVFTDPIALAGDPPENAGAQPAAARAGAAAKSIRRSVSVTSDGMTTVRTTTTVRDGITETIIETTGPDGKTTTTREAKGKGVNPAGGQQAQAPAGPRAVAGLRVTEASAVLREQLGLDEREGLVVDLIDPAGPAAEAGVLEHDILLRVNDRPVGRPAEFRQMLGDCRPGDEIRIALLRKGRPGQVRIVLAAAPEHPDVPPEDAIFVPDAAAGALQDGFKVEIKQGGNEALEMLLRDPDVPEHLKEMLRKSEASPLRGQKP